MSVTALTLSAMCSPSYWRLRGHTNLFCPGPIRCSFSLQVSGFHGHFVKPGIFYRGDSPGEILSHAVDLDSPPGCRVAPEHCEGLANRTHQDFSIVGLKLKSGALPCFRIERLDRIVEPARGSHQRYGTVF